MTRQEKLTYAAQARAMIARGLRQAETARELGLTPVQLLRILRLDPEGTNHRAAPQGRPAIVPLTPGDIILLRRHRLLNKIHSLAAAVDAFLDDPDASAPAVRAFSSIIS